MGNKKNQRVRKELEEEYGPDCMLKKAVSEKELRRRKIKTYRQFVEEKQYTRKFIRKYENIKTLHHFKHVSEGRRNHKRKWGNSKCSTDSSTYIAYQEKMKK